MTRLVWGATEDRVARYGLDRGVLYPRTVPPVVWNGLVSISEQTEADPDVAYLDGQRYVQRRSPDSFAAAAEAVTYPDELEIDPVVDLSYRTIVQDGYELHLVYNVSFFAKEIEHHTDGSDAVTNNFAWDLATVPELMGASRATSHIIISSLEASAEVLDVIETLIYGDEITQPRVPHLTELLGIFEEHASFVVTDNGDGTWTATGPDNMIEAIDAISYKITTPSIIFDSPTTYRIRSW